MSNICTHIQRQKPLVNPTSGGHTVTITDLPITSHHPFRSFDALNYSTAPRFVHSFMFSSHRFLLPSLLLPPFTVPCRKVFERPEDLEIWTYHLSFLLWTVVSKSSYESISCLMGFIPSHL